jgi:hypothetical protein
MKNELLSNSYPQVKLFNLAVACLLALFIGFSATVSLSAQEPYFTESVANPYNWDIPMGQDTAIRVRFVDLDHDDTLELMINMAENVGPLYEWRDFHYYENTGSNSDPNFVFAASYPFGIPDNTLNWMWQLVDVDGDGLEDFVTAGFIFNNPVSIIFNTGTAAVPDFSSSFTLNPFGLMPPASDADGSMLDGIFPTFVDIDNDGDLDVFYGGFFLNAEADEAFYFAENIGTSTDPSYTEPTKNPFGLVFPPATTFHAVSFADIDCDGDQDLYLLAPPTTLLFFENTGSPAVPDFSQLSIPLDLAQATPLGDFIDLGGDGDQDLITGGNSGVHYFENHSDLKAAFASEVGSLEASFTDESTGGKPINWLWEFGDGTSSEEQHPVHAYAATGTYEVCLTVDNLCQGDQLCQTIEIPLVGTKENDWLTGLTISPNPVRDQLTLEFNATETIGEIEILIWDNWGRPVGKQAVFQLGNTAQEKIDVSDLPAGVFNLEIRSAGRFIVRSFVHLK